MRVEVETSMFRLDVELAIIFNIPLFFKVSKSKLLFVIVILLNEDLSITAPFIYPILDIPNGLLLA